jgi:hypothetical protein
VSYEGVRNEPNANVLGLQFLLAMTLLKHGAKQASLFFPSKREAVSHFVDKFLTQVMRHVSQSK